MMFIKKYIKEYGSIELSMNNFNEVDALILSAISYVDFYNIISSGTKKITLERAANNYFNYYDKKHVKKTVQGVISGVDLLKEVYNTQRYKNLLLYNYVYNASAVKQFSAFFIDIDDENTFLTFEGTDELISGWKEDLQMSYLYPVPAQKDAINFFRFKVNPFTSKNFILGGHSKGGNLALVSAMEAPGYIKSKIKKIYMFDSPGLRRAQINTRKYKSIENKIVRIIPSTSIVGLTLRHTGEFNVVKCDKAGMNGHDFLNWQIKDGEFVKGTLSKPSIRFDNLLTDWLDNYNDTERREFVTNLFEILDRSGINSVVDIKSAKLVSIVTIIKETKKIDPKSKRMIKELVNFIFDYFKQSIKTKIKKK